ncbi:hypothetical protein [Rhodococcus sp. NPDC058481]|uniref:hypothetical protein n=1 Tax=unclassified Rhodococcus (in: high G+C Gram-positive bacteria) TaxID=192944 RepID=UPI0036635D12
MDHDEPLFAELGVMGTMPALPDDVWERALSTALDPTTAAVDPDLVPEMDDDPVVPEDDEIILYDDADDVLLDSPDDLSGPLDTDDDFAVGSAGDAAPDLGADDLETGAFEPTVDDGDFDSDGGLDLGGDLY